MPSRRAPTGPQSGHGPAASSALVAEGSQPVVLRSGRANLLVTTLVLGLILVTGLRADSGSSSGSAASAQDHSHGPKSGHGHDHGHGSGADDGAGHGEGGHGEHHGVVLRGEAVEGPFGQGTEFLAIDTKTMGFTLLLFGLLYVILNRYAWGPLLAALDDREMRIRQAIEDAKLARKEIERLGAETDIEIGKAHDEAKAVLDQARAEAGREVEQKLAEARARLAAQQQEALAAIEQARVQALAELRERSIELAATMAGRVANKRLNANEFRPLLEEVAN